MRSGEVNEIKLKGLTSAQNDYECGDGELQVCHNAVNTGNGLRPVQDVETVAELPAGWKGIVFVHHTSDGDRHIVVDGSGNAWWYGDDAAGRKEITEPAEGLFTEGGYVITSVGNVMIAAIRADAAEAAGVEPGLHYYRWKGGEGYKYLGQSPPDIGLEFSAIHYSGTVTDSGTVIYDDQSIIEVGGEETEVKFRADMQFSQGSMQSYGEAFEDFPTWLDAMLGNVNKIKAAARRAGLFTSRFFVRTAYRLYDGSYIMQGAPVLVAPETEDNPMLWPYNIKAELKKDSAEKLYWEIGVKTKMLFKLFTLGVKATAEEAVRARLADWEDVIDRVVVFITPQMQDYTEDPTYMQLVRKEKMPYVKPEGIYNVIEDDQTRIDGRSIAELREGIDAEPWRKGAYRAYQSDEGYFYGTRVSRRYPPPRTGLAGGDLRDTDYVLPSGNGAKDDNEAADMVMESQNISFDTSIEGGDFSAELHRHQYIEVAYGIKEPAVISDQTKKDYYIRMLTEFGGFHHTVRFEPKPGSAAEQAEQQYRFYKIKEYTIEEALRIGTAEDAENRTMEWPVMTLNISSGTWPRKGETIAAPRDMSFVKIAQGTLDTLEAQETLTDDYSSWQKTVPQTVHTYNGRLNAADLTITFRDMPWAWVGGQDFSGSYNEEYRYEGQAVIDTEGGRTRAALPGHLYRPEVNAGFFYYPHPDAKRIELLKLPYEDDGEPARLYVIELKPHPFLHGAYFYDDDFELTEHEKGTYPTAEEGRAAMTAADGAISRPNYMYTSGADNPFFFPAEGVNAVGTGRIIALKNAAKAMSEGTAFGAAPLYAFCTDGIWPLTVGTTGLFVATNPPSRETLLNNDPDSAIQTDNAVIFLSGKGLMRLTGERTTLLSGDLTEKFSTFDVADLPEWNHISTLAGGGEYLEADDFIHFIKTGARIAFDYENYRIIIFKPYDSEKADTHVAFIYDLVSKMWSTADSTLTSSIEGYPSSMVNKTGGNGVTAVGRFGADGGALTGGGKMIYTTRPMKLGKPDVLKTVRTLIERSISHGGTKYLALWGSRDMVSWRLIGAVNGARMPRISGTPYKYYIAAGWSTLDIHGDAISRVTIEEKDKYQDKLR